MLHRKAGLSRNTTCSRFEIPILRSFEVEPRFDFLCFKPVFWYQTCLWWGLSVEEGWGGSRRRFLWEWMPWALIPTLALHIWSMFECPCLSVVGRARLTMNEKLASLLLHIKCSLIALISVSSSVTFWLQYELDIQVYCWEYAFRVV